MILLHAFISTLHANIAKWVQGFVTIQTQPKTLNLPYNLSWLWHYVLAHPLDPLSKVMMSSSGNKMFTNYTPGHIILFWPFWSRFKLCSRRRQNRKQYDHMTPQFGPYCTWLVGGAVPLLPGLVILEEQRHWTDRHIIIHTHGSLSDTWPVVPAAPNLKHFDNHTFLLLRHNIFS